MSRLLIHCGLHKTGTTSIQNTLSECRERLAAAGLLYPISGSLSGSGGHHNIAWALTKDRRFRAEAGGVHELVTELAGFAGDALVSSEDFETVLGRSDLLPALLGLARESGRQLTLIVYVRSQSSYVRSLYQTLLRHGLCDEFSGMANQVVTEGYFSFREWQFQFSYKRIIQTIDDVGGISVILRNYDELAWGCSVVDDLAGILRICDGLLDSPAAGTRWAQRDEVGDSLAAFYKGRTGRQDIGSPELAVLNDLLTRLRGWKGILGAELSNAFAERFQPENASLCDRLGLARIEIDVERSAENQPGVLMERLFSDQTVSCVGEIAKLADHDASVNDLFAWFTGA